MLANLSQAANLRKPLGILRKALTLHELSMPQPYLNPGPSREDVDQMPGPVVLEFGADWCGYCQRAAPAAEQAWGGFPSIAHLKVEDGPGRRLGRSFRVKLWPTFVFLKEGVEIARLVRPEDAEPIRRALEQIA